MLLGALGAAVSYQRRLQESFDEDGWILNTTLYVGSGIGVKITPVQGAIFAVVLVMIASCGLVSTLADVLAGKPPPNPNTNSTNSAAITAPAGTGETKTAATPPTPTPTPGVSLNTLPPILSASSVQASAAPAVSSSPSASSGAPLAAKASLPPSSCAGSDAWRYAICGPRGLGRYAQMLVLAFIAGFAERLVPDTLDRLSGKKASGSQS
jgi:hypothetical protein